MPAAKILAQIVVPGLGEERASVLPHAGRPVALQAVEGDLHEPRLVEQIGDPPGHFQGQFGVRQEHLVAVVHQLGDRRTFGMRRGLGLIDASPATEQSPRRLGGHRFVGDEFLADLHSLERVVLHLVEPLRVLDRNLRLGGVDIFRQHAAADLRQAVVRDRRDIGIIRRDEIGQRMHAQTNPLGLRLLHTLLHPRPAMGELTRVEFKMSPCGERPAMIEVLQPACFVSAIASSIVSSPKPTIRYAAVAPGDTFPQTPSIIGCGSPSATSIWPIVSSVRSAGQPNRAILLPTTPPSSNAGAT